jgi:hypothetical protein
MGILERQGRGAISQNAVPESTIRPVIGSVNTSAFYRSQSKDWLPRTTHRDKHRRLHRYLNVAYALRRRRERVVQDRSFAAPRNRLTAVG